MRRIITFLLFFILVAVVAIYWQRSDKAAENNTEASLIPLLAEVGATGFSRATVPGAVEFPQDLGPHDDYQTEWWYYTGTLESEGGQSFGFQLTFFRRALTSPAGSAMDCPEGIQNAEPVSPQNACPQLSSWRTDQIYLAHFSISDIGEDEFYHFERFSRGAAGLAGAQAKPYRVWLENWKVEQLEAGVVHLVAQANDVTLDLQLTETVPPILHGDAGLSQKGPEPGNASYYYSIVQQKAEGKIVVKGQNYAVSGLAWQDHEYSSSALSPDAVGWDWFSLQLDDGSALMLFQIRNNSGSLEPASSGTYMFPDGTTIALDNQDWQLEVLDTWTSPSSRITYPAGWQLNIPSLELSLSGQPMMANQELNVSTTYWEGATTFEGLLDGHPVSGKGYVELTGYGDSMSGRL